MNTHFPYCSRGEIMCGEGAPATHYTNVDISLPCLSKINGHYQNGNKAFYHGNSRVHPTVTLEL